MGEVCALVEGMICVRGKPRRRPAVGGARCLWLGAAWVLAQSEVSRVTCESM